MSFEALLGKINEAATLNKALPAAADDKKIEAAAGGAGNNGNGGDDNDNDDLDDEDDQDDEQTNQKPLTKSFVLKLEDGTDLEAFDGTELVKSLTLRVDTAESALKQNEEHVLKSLNAAVDLISVQSVELKAQGTLIKSLQDKVNTLAKSGRGRMSTLIMADKPQLETVNKSQPAAMGTEELLAKTLGAMKAGRITGLEASGIENRLRMGVKIDPDLIAKVCG